MIVICPSCSAQYLLPDESVGAKGRRVKCTSCGYTWLQSPEGDPASVTTAESLAGETPAAPRQMITPVAPEAKGGKAIGIGLATGIVVFVITLVVMIAGRENLVRTWPPMALLFDKLHMPVDAPGIGFELKDVTATLVPEVAPEKLIIRGTIVNTSNQDKRLPSLLIRADGENGWLKDWPINLYGKSMPAGKSVPFEYALPDLPKNMTEVIVRFSEG